MSLVRAAGEYECGLSSATQLFFTTSRGLFDPENQENHMTKLPMAVLALAMVSMLSAYGASLPEMPVANPPLIVAQSMMPPTGTDDAMHPMSPEERMKRRFPQPVRVGDLIGLRVLNDDDLTLGFVQQVVRTPEGKIQLIVSYSKWLGYFGRPVAVPIEAVAILGRQLDALDMPPSDFAAAPTWQSADATVLSADDTIRIALGRR
jgi:hypothetical protein